MKLFIKTSLSLSLLTLISCGSKQNSTVRDTTVGTLETLSSEYSDDLKSEQESNDNSFNFTKQYPNGALHWELYRINPLTLNFNPVSDQYDHFTHNTALGKHEARVVVWHSEATNISQMVEAYTFNFERRVKNRYLGMKRVVAYKLKQDKSGLELVKAMNGQLPNASQTSILTKVSIQDGVTMQKMSPTAMLEKVCAKTEAHYKSVCAFGKRVQSAKLSGTYVLELQEKVQ